MTKAKIISILQMKGGVGKTTCAVNLASIAARDFNKKVLLVDFDPQTNATLSLIPEKEWKQWDKDHGTIADVLGVLNKKNKKKSENIRDLIIKQVNDKIPNLDLLPSHLKLTFLDLNLAARPGRERIFSRKIEKVRENYDLIICDCPPNLLTVTQNAIYGSQFFLIPMQPDYLSTLGLKLILNRVSYLKKNLQLRLRCAGVIFSRVRAYVNYHKETIKNLRKDKIFQNLYFFKNFIPENIKLGEAPERAEPIVIYDSGAAGSLAFKELTKEFLKRINDIS